VGSVGKNLLGALNGAVVAIDNASGGLLAVVGSRDFDRLEYDLAVRGARPMASTIKPLVYAAYLRKTGATIEDRLSNTPLSMLEALRFNGGKPIAETAVLPPGRHSIRVGLQHSSNRMAIRVGIGLGWESWEQTASRLGIAAGDYQSEAAAWIGAYPVSPLHATAAFASLARGGSYVQPWLVKAVRQQEPTQSRLATLYRHRPQSDEVFGIREAQEIHKGLRAVMIEGTASRVARQFAIETGAAGKTGTADEVTDA